MLKGFINNYFGFNKQQRNGLFVLALISFCLLAIRLTYPAFIKPDNIVLLDLPLMERKLDSTYKASNASKSYSGFQNNHASFFVFDPNTVSLEQLLKLGFKEKNAQIFLKFRSRGFVFRQKSDLKKVYGISDKFYSQLEPYILIPSTNSKENVSLAEETKSTSKINVTESKRAQSKIELNSADSISLISLNGIGPAFAKRILKYRTVLGGYVSVEQLKEVYGFDEELYQKVRNSFYVDARSVKKLNLNKDDFKVINKHPYLTYEHTKNIFDWRRKTSINPNNLKEILSDELLYTKLLPYLSFE